MRLRAPLRRVIRLFLRVTRLHYRQVHLVLGLPGQRMLLRPERAATQKPTILSLLVWHMVHKKGALGDPKTDHSLSVGMAPCASAILVGDSPHPGGLATQTAITAPASPGLNPDSAISRAHDPVHPDAFPSSQLALGPVHLDGFPSISNSHEQRDGFPSSAELSEDRDGFPRPGDTEYSDTVFLWDYHTGENSE